MHLVEFPRFQASSPKSKILLVDDDEIFRSALSLLLVEDDFEVVEAADVKSAIRIMGEQVFDALLSDLHVPGPADGLTVVSVMRHLQPRAITIILSAHPEMKKAAAAILRQADEVIVKAFPLDDLIGAISRRLRDGTHPPRAVETVASILERETEATIQEWLDCVDVDPLVEMVPLFENARCEHLPQFFSDLVFRLRNPSPLGRRALDSPAAAAHGLRRRQQGYTAAMLVEESRMLQNSIFQTLQNNLDHVDFGVLMVGVMAIADEIDSQLAQSMASYTVEKQQDHLSTVA